MAKVDDALAAKQSTINVLVFVNLILGLLLVYSMYVNKTTRDNFTISIPPDLRAGAIVRPDEFNAATVHAFASSTFIELQRWEEDGQVDYGKKISELTPRFTPTYREYLVRDMNKKNGEGELRNRTRYAIPAPGSGLYDANSSEVVRALGDGAWAANLRVTIIERIADFEVKRTNIEYPLVVRRANISPEKNLWGLVIDGYVPGEEPRVLSEEEINIETLG